MAATSTFPSKSSFNVIDTNKKNVLDLKGVSENPNERIGANVAKSTDENLWKYIKSLTNIVEKAK